MVTVSLAECLGNDSDEEESDFDEIYFDCVESIPYDEPSCVSCGNLLRCEICDW